MVIKPNYIIYYSDFIYTEFATRSFKRLQNFYLLRPIYTPVCAIRVSELRLIHHKQIHKINEKIAKNENVYNL